MSHHAFDKLEPSHSGSAFTHIRHDTETTHAVLSDEGFAAPPNTWSRIRKTLREPFAEFLGTLMFVLFGNCVNCQVFLSMDPGVVSSPRGDFLSLNFGWAAGVALGLWVCAGVSGGHINPSVTIALATFRGFPWKKVPTYILAQLLGGICGAGIAYANYFHAINIVEGGRNIRTIAKTGDLFAAYPLSILTPVSCFSDEFMGSAILIIGILAVTDKKNAAPPAGLLPMALFFIVLGIGAAMGMNTSYALNPARDLGPRVLTALVGYGIEVFTFKNHYWFWCPLLGSVLGMLFGTLAYDSLIYTGDDSIVNKPSARSTNSAKQSPRVQVQRVGKHVDAFPMSEFA